jgi:pimeloyl-ACP methyl ester carboxylesterase
VTSSEREVRGVPTPLLEAGPADRDEAVVFVHGNPGSGRDFERLLRGTGEFARAVAPDMPGFGRAERPKDFSYSVEGYVQHLDALLDDLGIRRAHLVLHDFGGIWGTHWAAEHPDRLASATLINTGVLLRYRWHRLARIWRTPGLGELFTATTTRSGFKWLTRRENGPRDLPEPFLDRMFDDLDRGTKRAILRLYRATPDPAERSARISAVLREHPAPALVVWGARDPYIGVEHAERQREAFPGAAVTILEDSGHWPFADDPEAVEAAVLPFLRAHAGAPAPA